MDIDSNGVGGGGSGGGARDRLLDAARRVFAHHGPGGATTRRIAEEAGVNEVTMFRIFGSKEALLEEAARVHATGEHAMPLPESPADPQKELALWCAREIERLRESREFIMQCLAGEAGHPKMAENGAVPMMQAAEELRAYVDRLHGAGLLKHPEDRAVAVSMLLSTMYSDALGRTTLPDVHPTNVGRAPALYVRLFLRALGVKAKA